jgi:hypothetical protein
MRWRLAGRVRRAEVQNPRGELLTRIDDEQIGWETYGILCSTLHQAMVSALPERRLRLGTTCMGATEDGRVLASRQAGRAAEMASPRAARVRDRAMKVLPDRLTVALQRRIVEYRP